MVGAARTIDVVLDDDERRVLISGVSQWGGPGRLTDDMVRAIGFRSEPEAHAECRRLRSVLKSGAPLSSVDWTRALLSTEVAFISDAYGAGVEWEIVTPFEDVTTLAVIRRLQRKLVGITVGVVRTGQLPDGPPEAGN